MRSAALSRSARLLGIVAAAALVLVACDTAGTDDTTDDPPVTDETDDVDPDAAPDPDADPDAPVEGVEDLPDPNEFVEDEVFRGAGIVMPAPDGWRLDEMSFAQGWVVAIDEVGQQTLAGQAVDTGELPEGIELDFDQLLADSRDEFEEEPAADEEVELSGASRAHLLRFDDLAAPEEGGSPSTFLTIIAEDGEGELAMFNYIASSDGYDEGTETLLLETAGFDPDSEPTPPLG